MRRDPAWMRWALGSARTWRDITNLVPETGIDLVDGEHRGLLEMALDLNVLADEAKGNPGAAVLDRQKDAVKGLLERARLHFSHEEALIASIGAPGAERQATEHARIVETLETGIGDFLEGRLAVSPEMRRSIFTWIVDHIAGTDYEMFKLANLELLFSRARTWEDLARVIRSTGVDSLDAEHRLLGMAILDALALLRGEPVATPACEGAPLGDALSRIARTAARHFAHEEGMMAKLGIGGLGEHAALHAGFVSRIEAMAAAAASIDPAGADALSRDLLSWLADHVNRVDYEVFRAGDWMPLAFESLPASDLVDLVRATGVGAVDGEHREFVGLAAGFCESFAGSDPAAVAERFDALVRYAARHFAHEESLFPVKEGYMVARHREEHAGLLAILSAYRGRIAEGRVGAGGAVKGILMGMWVHHTNGTDIDTFGSAAMTGGLHAR